MARNWSWNHYARVGKDGRVDESSLAKPVPWSKVQRSQRDGWALIVEG
jgi:hypothetical protein